MAALHGRDAAEVCERRDEPSAFLAHVLTGLLLSDLAVAAAWLLVPMASRSDIPFELELDLKPVLVLWRLAFLATVVVFLVWFYEARVSAERSGWPQRRARGWTFWGWVIPIADLWIPFQIMRDIWRASLPPSSRSKAAWLPSVWWISWLLEGLLSKSWNRHSSGFGYGLALPANWASFALLAVSGISLALIIQVATRHHEYPRMPDWSEP